jgi:pimeloyl-ACP methyl ester carboxylesterase
MPRPLLLIHGYSATGLDFTNLYWALVDRNIEVELLNVGNYISLNNEITIEDISEGLQRAISLTKLNSLDEFDAIVHSTGMLVVRAWLAHQKIAPGENQRLKRLKHLIGLAPATWGSPQAHKGRT